jgi:hypothetical protein
LRYGLPSLLGRENMTTYETLILINETGNLIGQIMFDVLSVAFAILVAGFVMGKRLNNGMIGVITALSGAWVIPMMNHN